MERCIKELTGYSGSRIYLMESNGQYFVRKIGNIERNLERLIKLSAYNVPEIYKVSADHLDMEYIQGLDIKNYLLYHDINKLIDFIIETFDRLSNKTKEKNYCQTYLDKLVNVDFSQMPFTMKDLFDRLPKTLPQSEYHGDFTLDNILYHEKKKKFYMIDPLTTEYDSYIFDLAKLNQDLKCGWFNRNTNINLTSKLQKISDVLNAKYNYIEMNSLLILMLLRVFPYCKNESDRYFILNNVRDLWT